MELKDLNRLVIDWIISYEYLKQFCHKNERPSHTKKIASMELKHLKRDMVVVTDAKTKDTWWL